MRTGIVQPLLAVLLLVAAAGSSTASPAGAPETLEEGLTRVRRTLLIAVAQLNHGFEGVRAAAARDKDLGYRRAVYVPGGFGAAADTLVQVSTALALLHARFGGPLERSPVWSDLQALAKPLPALLEEASRCDPDPSPRSDQVMAAVVQDIVNGPGAAHEVLGRPASGRRFGISCGNCLDIQLGMKDLVTTSLLLREGKDVAALTVLTAFLERGGYGSAGCLAPQTGALDAYLRFRVGDREGAEATSRRLALETAGTLEGDIATRLLAALGSFHQPTAEDYQEAMRAASDRYADRDSIAVGFARNDFPGALATLQGWRDRKLIGAWAFVEALGWLSAPQAPALLHELLPCDDLGTRRLILHSLLRLRDPSALDGIFELVDEQREECIRNPLGSYSAHPGLPNGVDSELRDICGDGPVLSDQEVHDVKRMRAAWRAWVASHGLASAPRVRPSKDEHRLLGLSRDPLVSVSPLATSTAPDDRRALAELLAHLPSRRPREPDQRELQRRKEADEAAARAQAVCRDLPGFEQISRLYTWQTPSFGEFNSLPYCMHVMLAAREPSGLINHVWWFDPADEATRRPRFDWNDLLATLALVEAAASKHVWLRTWRDTVRNRQVQACIIGRTPITATHQEYLVLPAWKSAGLSGKPAIELALRRDGRWCGTVFLGSEDPRALVVQFSPIKSSHWLDALDLRPSRSGSGSSAIVVEPNGDHRLID